MLMHFFMFDELYMLKLERIEARRKKKEKRKTDRKSEAMEKVL